MVSIKIKQMQLYQKKLVNLRWINQTYYIRLRNDISLVFQISSKTRHLIGSDYFFKHCIFETDNREWSGNRTKRCAEFVSSTIYSFTEASENTVYDLIPLQC